MKKYIIPAIKVVEVGTESILAGSPLHNEEGDGEQLSKKNLHTFNDEFDDEFEDDFDDEL